MRCLALVFLSLPVAGMAAPATYKLGGHRQVSVSVELADDSYTVVARMLPVTSFDAATNTRINRLKAEHYALMGLGRHLSSEKNIHLEVSGARVTKTAEEGKFFTLTLTIPRKGVRLVKAGEKTGGQTGGVRVLLDHPFLTRKRDQLDTLRQLADGLAADLAAARPRDPKDPRASERFLLVIAELEERGDEQFRRFESETNADKLFLTLERDEILAELDKQRKRWRESLRMAARSVDPTAKKEL